MSPILGKANRSKRLTKVTWSICVILSVALEVAAQEPRVRKIYYKDEQLSVTKTAYLPLINTPAQLLQLQLTGRVLKRSEQVEDPEKLTITLNSHGPAPLYQKDSDHRLTAIADGKTLDLGLLTYRVLKSTPGGPKGDYIANPSSGWIMRIPVEGSVFTTNPAGWVIETMYLDVQLEQLKTVINASRSELRLGNSTVLINDSNRSVLAQFLSSLLSSGGAVEDPDEDPVADEEMGDIGADAPSQENGTPLDQTVAWLKSEIAKRATHTDASGSKIKVEVTGSSQCEIRYRGTQPEEKASIYDLQLFIPDNEYILKLEQVNPEAVKVSNPVDGLTWISLAIVDGQPTIEKRIIEFGSGRILSKSYTSILQVSIRPTKSAYRLGDAIRTRD